MQNASTTTFSPSSFFTSCKTFPKYFQNISKLFPKYFQTISKIFPKYFQNTSKIFPKYFQDISKIFLEDAKCFHHHVLLSLLRHILHNISKIFPSLSFIKLSWSPDSLLHEIIWVLLWATRALHIHWTLNIHWILFIVLLWTPPWTVHKDKDYHMMITTALMSMAMMMMKTFTMMMMIMMIRHGAWWWWWWRWWGMMDLCELQLFGWQLPLSHFPYSDTFLLPHPPPLNTQMLFYFSTPSTPLLP